MVFAAGFPALLLGRRRSRRVVEIAEEVGVRAQDHGRSAGAAGLLLGLHAPVEGIEILILVEGLGIDPGGLAIGLALQDLGLEPGFGLDDGDLAVGRGGDAGLLLVALGAQLAGLALAVGLHAVIDRLGVGLRQICTLDAHVDGFDAQLLCLGIH